MKILITNDDGIHNSMGFETLYKRVAKIGDVTVVVPDAQKSGSARSMTLHEPLRVNHVGKKIYIVNGTPSDCVRLGVRVILKEKANMVISGINSGANLGDDTGYSGTVGGAMEGCMLGLPSFAVSLVLKGRNNYDTAALFAVRIAEKIKKHKLPKKTYLNVNVPDLPYDRIKGISITYQGNRIYSKNIQKLHDPKGRSYYWLSAERSSGMLDRGSDLEAINRNRVSITPLTLDFTDYKFLSQMKKWDLNKWSPTG